MSLDRFCAVLCFAVFNRLRESCGVPSSHSSSTM
jgi:hypothetical protein